MKKMNLAVSMLVVSVLALSVAAPALAAGPSQGGPGYQDPADKGSARSEYRQDSMRGEGLMENRQLLLNREINLDGLMDDLIHEELALAFELDPAVLTDRLENGETIFEIAISLGMDNEAANKFMADARLAALSEAVGLGLITQEQSDWLASRGFGNPSLETGMICQAD